MLKAGHNFLIQLTQHFTALSKIKYLILSSKTDVQCLNDNLLLNIIFLLLVLLIL